MNRLRYLVPAITLLLAIFAGPVPAAHAQSRLVRATPAPDSTISLPPAEVRLVFDHPLLAEGTSLHVADNTGARVEKGNGRIDPTDPFALAVSLPVLFEGQYTVSYTAATVGSSTILADTFTFTLDLPNPILSLSVPENGEAFDPGPVPVRLETRFVDFDVYGSRVRLYVDGHLHREWTGLRASIDGLQPGVHEIRTVLVQVGQEVPDTSTTVYIAIKRSAPPASPPPPDPFDPAGSQAFMPYLSLIQLAEMAVVIVILLGVGIWLGRIAGP